MCVQVVFCCLQKKDDKNGSWGATEKAVASTTKKLFGLGLFLACVRLVTLYL